jgi:O-antigen/teichoic acid export membrane protein
MVLRYLKFFVSVGGARTAGILISAATFPFLVRMLGVEGFGRWSYVLAVVGFFDLVVNPGLVAHASREVAVHRLGANPLVSEVFTLRVLLGMLGSLCLIAYAVGVETDSETQWLLMSYGVPMLLLGAVQSAYLLTSNECFHWSSIQQVVSQVAYAIGVFALVRTSADLFLLALISVGSALLSAGIGWIKLRHIGFRLRWAWKPSGFVELLKQSLPFGAASLASQLYTRSGHIVVRWALGETALGLYSAVVRLAEVIYGFVGILFNLSLPRLAYYSAHEEKRQALSSSTFLIAWAISIPLAVGGSALAPEMVGTILGRQYDEGAGLFRIVSFYFLTNSMAIFFCGTVLYALGKRYRYLIATASGALFGLTVNVTLVPHFGLIAACLSYVCSQLVVAGVAYKMAPRDLPNIWRSRLFVAPLFGSVLMVAVLYAVQGMGWATWTLVALGGAIYTLATLAMAHRDFVLLLRR